jgi:hypothetical protein
MSQLSQEAKNSLKKYSMLEQMKISDFLLDQFKRVIDWNIDHMDLFAKLNNISQYL